MSFPDGMLTLREYLFRCDNCSHVATFTVHSAAIIDIDNKQFSKITSISSEIQFALA